MMIELLREVVTRVEGGATLSACMVVSTKGSTPQKAGALMLVLGTGKTLGTLGGGCVEAEVRTRAMKLMMGGDSRLLRFSLDRDYGWDDGLVCGGVMDIAVKTLASVEDVVGWRGALRELEAGRDGRLTVEVEDEAGEAVSFEHVVEASPTLVIAGGGHVGLALANVAGPMGFEVVVVDDRADYASAERFPGAQVVIGDIAGELSRMAWGANSYVVIVTRGHQHDADALGAVVGSSAKYVGLIGSRRKIHQIMKGLREEGATEDELERVHAPIGLAIGAVSPEEIAVSIAAELVAVRRGVQSPMSLKKPRSGKVLAGDRRA
ncbi:MAG: XdhC family protein [Planctomycetota bacterium]